MTILLADQFSELGGAQLCLLDLVPAFRERGWDVRAVLPGEGELARRLRRMNVPLEQIRCGPYRSGSKSVGDALRFSGDMVAAARALRPADLLYINGPRLLPAVALARAGCPVVFHAHSFVAQRAAAWLAAWSARLSRTTVIASSHYAGSWLHGLPVHRVNNGVPDCRRPRAARHGPWRVGVIGRIAPEKGQLEFVRAASLLAGEDWRFILFGAPSFSGAAYLARVRAAALALPVEFAGWTGDVAAALAELDVLAVPSVGNDATPRVIPEAFSAGVAVAASRTGGIPEVVEDGVNGFLSEPASPESLANTLRRIRAVDLGGILRQARECWERQYTLRHYQEGVCAVVDDLLGENSRRNEAAAASAAHAAMVRGKE